MRIPRNYRPHDAKDSYDRVAREEKAPDRLVLGRDAAASGGHLPNDNTAMERALEAFSFDIAMDDGIRVVVFADAVRAASRIRDDLRQRHDPKMGHHKYIPRHLAIWRYRI
jgi:hypothetical protein